MRKTVDTRPSTTARLVLVVALVVGIAAAVGAPPPAGAGPTTAVATWDTAVIDLPNGGIAYVPQRDVLLVAVAPTVPVIANHLVELDPQTGALGRTVPVGANPRAIAVSDDGTRAYVGGLGSGYVTEVDLGTFTVIRRIWLGHDQTHGPYYVDDIAVQPGDRDVIAVAVRYRGITPSFAGVAVYDAGVVRPSKVPGHTGPHRLAWSADPTKLFGASGANLYVLTVGPGGVTTSTSSPVLGTPTTDIEHADGHVVSTSGTVIHDTTLGAVGAYSASGMVEVDVARGRTYFLNGTTLTSHVRATRTQDGTRTVPAIAPTALVDAGASLAAAGPDDVLLLGPGVVSTGFVPPQAQRPHVRTDELTTAAVNAEEMTASPDGTRLYAVIRQTGVVVEIDAATGEVLDTLAVGAEPHRIAISSDGSTLMVGHHASHQLTEVAVADLSIRRTIALGDEEWANDIAARPGTASTFAVVLVNHCCSPALEAQILVQDGTVLPGRGPGHSGATTIAFTTDPNRLYGVNGGTTGYGFYSLGVGPTGLTPLSDASRVLTGFGQELVSAGGLVYSSNGFVADPTVPSVVGSVPGTGQIVPVPDQDRLLVVTGNGIAEYDLSTYAPVASHGFAGGTARDAVLVGSRLAVATTSGQVLLVSVRPPRTANESWVWAAYDDFLGREPTPAQAAQAVARLDSGVLRSTLARELATSDEWITHVVERFYSDTLGRPPSDGEEAYWVDQLRSGWRTVAQVAASFYASPEYYDGIGGGTPASWVEDLYETLLQRTADDDGLAYWTGQITAKGRTWVALQMFQSLESRRARVEVLYRALLGRPADAAGRDHWAARLTTEGDIALARDVAASPEYLARAATRYP